MQDMVTLSGSISSTNVWELENILDSYKEDYTGDILLNFSNVTYISSVGLRALLTTKKRIPGRLIIYNPSREVFEILKVTGFSEILDIQ